jgi:hypothetical protein
MPITHMHRAAILLAAVATFVPGVATAQSDDRRTLDGMRACAKIADPAQRTTCYDGYLQPQPASSADAAPMTPSTVKAGVEAWAPVAPARSKRTAVAEKPREPAHRYAGLVATTVEREPGIYLLTMRDGRQWRFASTVRASYDPPTPGSNVEIQPGALGSFLLSYNDQSAIRVIRVR